jgi:hypothetical protein
MQNEFGFLVCALELEADRVASGDSDCLGLNSYSGISSITPRDLREEIGKGPGE